MKNRGIIYLGADHAGYELKKKIKMFLGERGIQHVDMGGIGEVTDDYPDFALKVCKKVAKDANARGVLICGTGIGMCIVANKVDGIRAAFVCDEFSAKMSRMHNDANVICLRSRDFSDEENIKLVNMWLSTSFSREERHQRRIDKIKKIERNN